jgi:hypothetical protein
MWFLVQVVKGSKHYEPDSQVGNRVLISDTTEMVISARSMGEDGYRFEARRGSDSFVMGSFAAKVTRETIAARFTTLALQMGAVVPPAEA